MLNLRKLTMTTLGPSKASTFSLSQFTSPTPTHSWRAFYGTSSQNLALTGESVYKHSECLALVQRSLVFQPKTRGLLRGSAAMRYLHTQQRTLKGRGSISTQVRSLHSDADRHDHQSQFDTAQETKPCEGDLERSGSGSIHLIVGPMFAGKTTALLNRVEAEASAGRRVALVKSDKDTRYGLASIVSHDGRQMRCWAVSSLANFRSQIGEDEYAKLDLIGIDEAQFLKDLCSFCQAAADYDGKTLIVAGLDGDFQRNKFGSILDLVPLADTIIKLSSLCELCGKPASFTFRKTDNRNKEVIGGTDIYMPVCRQHYFSGKIAMEATRTVLDTHKYMPLQFGNPDKPTQLLKD